MPFVGYLYHVFGVLIHVFSFPFLYSCSINSLNSLPGSWLVFIVEMNTLFGCFGLRLEYECDGGFVGIVWRLLIGLTVLLLTIDF